MVKHRVLFLFHIVKMPPSVHRDFSTEWGRARDRDCPPKSIAAKVTLQPRQFPLAWARMRVVMLRGCAVRPWSLLAPSALLPCRRGRSVGVCPVALFRAFSGRSCRLRCCRRGVAFVGLVWAYFRPVARVALRVACAVAVLARFFALFVAFRRWGYMRIPQKRKSRL